MEADQCQFPRVRACLLVAWDSMSSMIIYPIAANFCLIKGIACLGVRGEGVMEMGRVESISKESGLS